MNSTIDGVRVDALPMPAPVRPTKEQAMQALDWLYNHPKADAVTEYTAIQRFIEQADSGVAASRLQSPMQKDADE